MRLINHGNHFANEMILQVPTKNGDFHRFPFIYQFGFLEATTFANMFLYLFRNHSLLCMLSLSHPICITSPCGTLCSHGHVLFRLHLWCPWVPQILALRPFWVSIPTRSQLGALTLSALQRIPLSRESEICRSAVLEL